MYSPERQRAERGHWTLTSVTDRPGTGTGTGPGPGPGSRHALIGVVAQRMLSDPTWSTAP